MNNYKYQAVLFDLDGTVLDTAPDIIAACNYTLNKFGYQSVEASVLKTKVTSGMRAMMKLGIKDYQNHLDLIENEMRQCFARRYMEHICDQTKVFDGIEELLCDLNKAGVKLAIITNKYFDMTSKLMSHFPFSKKFSLILGCDSLTKSKPHPEPILTALRRLEIPVTQAVYIGDHLNDIKAAKAAGCVAITALWGYGGKECGDPLSWGADFNAESPKALKQLLMK